MMHTHYRGGGKPRVRHKNYTSVCDVCGTAIPDDRLKLTCSDTCERAKRNKRTRAEQFWRDYADDKL